MALLGGTMQYSLQLVNANVAVVFPAQLMSSSFPQFAALAMVMLILIAILSAVLIGFLLWVAGIEVPGLSDVLKRPSGRIPSGQSFADFFRGTQRPLMAVLSGWVLLWIVLALTFFFYPAQTEPLPVRFILVPEDGLGPPQFAALALIFLVVIAILTTIFVLFLMWVAGVEIPGLSALKVRLTGREPTGPSVQDALGGTSYMPLATMIAAWVVLWIVAAPLLWFYPGGGVVLAEQQATPTEPAQAAAPTATPTDADGEPTATPAPSGGGPASAPSDTVMNVLTDNGCGGCHTISGVSGMAGNIGPELTNMGSVAAERIQAGDYTGEATTAEEYIHESIVDPQVYIVPDYQGVMPQNFDETIPSDQLDMLVEYLAGLE